TELSEIWDAFFRGRLILSIIIGIVIGVALSVVGMRNAMLLGTITGVLTMIPSLGPVLAGIPTVLLALFEGSTWLPLSHFWFAALVVVLYVAIFQLESLYLLPRIVGRRVRLHPAVVIAGTIGGAIFGGILGILLAAPVISSLRVIARYIYRKSLDMEPFELAARPRAKPGVRWRGLIAGRPVEAILFDLDGTLIETDDALVDRWARRLSWLLRLIPGANPTHVARRLIMWCEGPVSFLLSVLDRLHLGDRFFAFSKQLQELAGYTEPPHFRPVDGALSTLRALDGRYRLGLVTTRDQEAVEAFLTQYDLSHVFDAIVTRDRNPRLKPHPAPVRQAAEELDVLVEHCVLVGDTKVDIHAAHAAGALAIGVLCGFGEEQDLREADLILQSPVELQEWL
ncbi:MAG TPA: AI-2E family transporter, partial [Anaerolineae bacterium]|nr:AI-2E family transporter [Anaerolineae bacterium]